MTNDTERGARTRALEEAAEWLLRLRGDDVSEDMIEAWTGWLLADPGHARAFDDLSLLWDAFEPAGAEAGGPRAEVATPTVRHLPAPRAPRGRRRALVALAAGVGALSVGAWWLLERDAGVERVERMETAIGEHRRVPLPDGSVVDLGAASRIVVRYSQARREVELLAGEGQFSVAPAAERPFEVRAGDAVVRALGTRFSVSLRTQAVSVVVSEGRVQLNDLSAPASSPVQLVAGRAGILRSGAGIDGPHETEPADATAWMSGQIVYRGATVADVIADLNRYSGRPIVLVADSAELELVTGRWLTQDVDGWLEGLAAALSLDVVRERERILLVQGTDRGD